MAKVFCATAGWLQPDLVAISNLVDGRFGDGPPSVLLKGGSETRPYGNRVDVKPLRGGMDRRVCLRTTQYFSGLTYPSPDGLGSPTFGASGATLR